MNYFIFYKKTCIAYTDTKKIKNEFLKQFKEQEHFTVDKIKKVNDFYLDNEVLQRYSLYFNNYDGMYLNENIELELYEFIQQLNEKMVMHCDRLDLAIRKMRLADNEEYILSQFLLNYGFVIEDNETMFADISNIPYILEYHIFPILEKST